MTDHNSARELSPAADAATPKSAAPIRIQLSRAKGWRMPGNTVKVDRSTNWGNPFVIGETYPITDGELSGDVVGHAKIADAADAVDAFRPWCEEVFAQWGDLEPLRGKNLACWCKIDAPCHADVLLELANKSAVSESTDGPVSPGLTKTQDPQ